MGHEFKPIFLGPFYHWDEIVPKGGAQNTYAHVSHLMINDGVIEMTFYFLHTPVYDVIRNWVQHLHIYSILSHISISRYYEYIHIDFMFHKYQHLSTDVTVAFDIIHNTYICMSDKYDSGHLYLRIARFSYFPYFSMLDRLFYDFHLTLKDNNILSE